MASGFIPDVATQILASVSGVVVTIGVPLILAKLNKFDKLYTTVFGIDDVDQVSGLVGIVESHDSELESISDTVESVEDNIAELQHTVARLEDSVSDINGGTQDD